MYEEANRRYYESRGELHLWPQFKASFQEAVNRSTLRDPDPLPAEVPAVMSKESVFQV